MIYESILNTFKNLDNFQILMLVLITILFINQIRMSYSVEKMADTSEGTIRDTVKNVYQVDVQAIKNLSDFTKEIYNKDTGKFTIPGDCEISGNLLNMGNCEITGNLLNKGNCEIRGGKLVVSNTLGHERCIITGVGGTTKGGGTMENGKDIIIIPEQNGGNPGLVLGMNGGTGFTKGTLVAKSGIALQNNKLYLGNYGDNNYYLGKDSNNVVNLIGYNDISMRGYNNIKMTTRNLEGVNVNNSSPSNIKLNGNIVINNNGSEKIKLGNDGIIKSNNICFGNQCMANHKHGFFVRGGDKYWTGNPGEKKSNFTQY